MNPHLVKGGDIDDDGGGGDDDGGGDGDDDDDCIGDNGSVWRLAIIICCNRKKVKLKRKG